MIEGHTDYTQPRNAMDARTRFKYNWDLSARRASSVMYELHAAGLNKAKYNLIAWGRADTDPRCLSDSPRLDENRRTTIKVRFEFSIIRRCHRRFVFASRATPYAQRHVPDSLGLREPEDERPPPPDVRYVPLDGEGREIERV